MGPGHTIVVGARPSVGKSMLGCNLAMAACRRGVPTALFSHEMTSHELMQRMISCEAGVPLTNIRLGSLNEGHWEAVARATERIRQWPLVIDDEASMTIADYRARLRKLTRRRKAGLVISDYVQLVRPLDPRLPREQQVSQTSAGAKALAKDFGLPVVILAQLSRATESRKDAIPILSDLRESGSLENDADTVLLMHRTDNGMEIHVAKNRHGQTGVAYVDWQPAIMRVGSV
jgi:replicative DNA helicase